MKSGFYTTLKEENRGLIINIAWLIINIDCEIQYLRKKILLCKSKGIELTEFA